jgi:hypothetical protein
MTEIKDPSGPRTDELARNAALHALADLTENAGPDLNEDGVGSTEENAMRIADHILGAHGVTWERDVNAAGVPVRRYVMRGEWTVDPERLTP